MDGGGEESHEMSEDRSRELISLLPACLDTAETNARSRAEGGYLHVVLVQEVARYNSLIRVARNSLESVSLALQGRDVVSSDI